MPPLDPPPPEVLSRLVHLGVDADAPHKALEVYKSKSRGVIEDYAASFPPQYRITVSGSRTIQTMVTDAMVRSCRLRQLSTSIHAC